MSRVTSEAFLGSVEDDPDTGMPIGWIPTNSLRFVKGQLQQLWTNPIGKGEWRDVEQSGTDRNADSQSE